jgi:hypothetical protein
VQLRVQISGLIQTSQTLISSAKGSRGKEMVIS